MISLGMTYQNNKQTNTNTKNQKPITKNKKQKTKNKKQKTKHKTQNTKHKTQNTKPKPKINTCLTNPQLHANSSEILETYSQNRQHTLNST